MKDIIAKSPFYYFGILPAWSIYSPVQDNYSDVYVPEKVCECGSIKWKKKQTMILGFQNGIPLSKEIHRCKNCDKIRMAKHVGIKDQE